MITITDRQQKIYEWLKTKKNLSIDEIEEFYQISVASAYRDIRALVENGMAQKTSRGIKLATEGSRPSQREGKCAFCGADVNQRTQFILQMEDGSHRTACCSHCGLLALKRPGVQSALASDFIYGKMVNARQAYYLLESKVSMCCEPTALCFATEEDAQSFQRGFGGKVFTLDQAREHIEQLMNLS